MISQGQVGEIPSTADGIQVVLRAGKQGDQIVSPLHPRYYEATFRKRMFNAANQTGVTTTVGTAVTYTGLCLSNPTNSTVNVCITKVGIAFPVAIAAGLVYGIMVGYHAATAVIHTTPSTTLRSNFVGQIAGQALVDTAATLPVTPTVSHVLGALGTGAATVGATLPATFFDLDGSLILPPGAFACLFTSAASGASGVLGSFNWEEVPL